MSYSLDRREFLKRGLMAASALSAVPFQSSVRAEAGRGSAPKRVIVIGAGLAGLSAAYELTQAGHEVTVLEARTRPGGRVYTMRGQFADGLYAEAGATNVFDNHNWTMKYVNLMGIALDPIAPTPGASIYHVRGKRFVIRRGGANWPLDLKEDEKDIGRNGLWQKYVVPALKEIGNPEAADWPSESLKKYDQMTFAEFLRRQGASPHAAWLLQLGLADQLGEGANAVSALNMLREAAPRALVREAFVIRGGSDTLPRALASRLAERIRYGSPVARIEHDSVGVRVLCAAAGAHATFAADYLICAIPFSVLKRVEVSPDFAADKRRAITELGNTSVVRVFLQTRKRFWLDEGLSGASTTDLPIMTTYDKAGYLPGTRGMLEAYVAGERARQLAAMKPDERLEFTVKQMEQLLPNIRQHYEGGASVCWDEDEWARGAYAWFKPGQMSSMLSEIIRPEGRVHFAGDHTSPWPGWMQGALQSGNRAASEVSRAA